MACEVWRDEGMSTEQEKLSPTREKEGVQAASSASKALKVPIDIETTDQRKRIQLIIALMWPALAENVLATLVSMVDVVMVSGLGSYAISAVGLVTQPRFIMLSAFMALSVGATALVARFKGADDPVSANNVLSQSLLVTAVLSLALCLGMLAGAEPLIRFLAGSEISEQTIQAAVDYFDVQIYGFPLLSLTFTMTAVLRGAGNTRASFYSNTAANLTNVFFNYCMIGGNLGFPALGVMGASIATVIGQGVAFVFCAYLLLNGKQYVKLDLKAKFRLDLEMIRRILRIGVPALIEQVVMRVGMLLFTMTVTSLGDNPYAAHMVAMNIQQLSFTTGMAFGTAATTLVGQCLGRMRADLAKIYVRLTQNMGYVVSILVALLLFFFGSTVARLYSSDAVIIGMSAQVLKIMAVANPLSNARFVYTSALRGAGDSRFTAWITFIGVLFVRPVMSYLLINLFDMGLTGVWIALVSDSLSCCLLSWLRYRSGKWAKIKV